MDIAQIKTILTTHLPKRIFCVLYDYVSFSSSPPPKDDVKAYAAFHATCRGTLTHLLVLMKLMSFAESSEESDKTTDWIVAARLALNKIKEQTNDDTIDNLE